MTRGLTVDAAQERHGLVVLPLGVDAEPARADHVGRRDPGVDAEGRLSLRSAAPHDECRSSAAAVANCSALASRPRRTDASAATVRTVIETPAEH